MLSARQAAGTLRPRNYIVKTLVTTELMRRIADSYGVQTAGDLLVGFKYIGGEMDRRGPEDFVFGAEESYGFLAGDHVRDKDGAVAAMLLGELAARLKAGGQTLLEQLDALFRRHGCHAESQLSVQMPGEKGMDDMKALMAGLRQSAARGHRRHERGPSAGLSPPAPLPQRGALQNLWMARPATWSFSIWSPGATTWPFAPRARSRR